MWWPPDLVVGGRGDCPQLRARNGAPDRGMKMRCPAFLRFDGAEVLHVPPDAATGVLPESIDQRGEVDRVPRGTPVVIVIRVHRRPVIVYAPVGIERERQERGRPVAPGDHLPE